MIAAGVRGVEYFACNTDLQALRKCAAPNKLQIGGAADQGPGRRAPTPTSEETPRSRTRRSSRTPSQGADMVFLAAGLGRRHGLGRGPDHREARRGGRAR